MAIDQDTEKKLKTVDDYFKQHKSRVLYLIVAVAIGALIGPYVVLFLFIAFILYLLWRRKHGIKNKFEMEKTPETKER